jgi:DNA-binding NarL/FixJ family response regulator
MYFIADIPTVSTAGAGTPSSYSGMDWLVLAMVTLAITYLLLRNSAKKKQRDPLDGGGIAGRMSLAQQRATERQMESLLVELSEMSRQISSQLDTRAAKLEALIREADEKIEQLQNARPDHGPTPSVQRRQPPMAEEEEERPPMRLVVPEAVDPRHAEVYRLADQGQTPQQIAQRLGRPSGEIELILALRAR